MEECANSLVSHFPPCPSQKVSVSSPSVDCSSVVSDVLAPDSKSKSQMRSPLCSRSVLFFVASYSGCSMAVWTVLGVSRIFFSAVSPRLAALIHPALRFLVSSSYSSPWSAMILGIRKNPRPLCLPLLDPHPHTMMKPQLTLLHFLTLASLFDHFVYCRGTPTWRLATVITLLAEPCNQIQYSKRALSVLKIPIVLADGVSKFFFSRERPFSARGKTWYFAIIMDTNRDSTH